MDSKTYEPSWFALTSALVALVVVCVLIGLRPDSQKASLSVKTVAGSNLSADGKIFFDYIGTGKLLTIPEGVEVIADSAFDHLSEAWGVAPKINSTGLRTIVVPASLKEIARRGFRDCRCLEAFEVAEDNPNFCSIDGVLYSKDGKTLLSVPEAIVRSASIDHETGDVVEPIVFVDDSSFHPVRRIKGSFVVPDGVETIGSYAFCNCSSLTSIVLPDSVKEIAPCAFYGCDWLEDVKVSKNVERIGARAFNFCRSLKRIDFSDGVREIGAGAFAGCSSLETFVVPSGVKEIPKGTFDHCDSLKSTIIPSSVEKIDFLAISPVDGLTIVAPKGSPGEEYAKGWKINYSPL
ncbi:MAG: leucine-rich repeat domain-containing protein [Thermoguttaceae bacterium]|nr:leucine-rich repeat domain-containing protein [Thermoguttaceae bacterium]MBR5759560.1 leucine-rich repeat domain-containing protein [Thermoguttaceae bacterium]